MKDGINEVIIMLMWLEIIERYFLLYHTIVYPIILCWRSI